MGDTWFSRGSGMQHVEHRQKMRHQINAITYVAWGGRLAETKAVNISPQGILLKSPSLSCPPNLKIEICCTINKQLYKIPGITIHNREGYIGVEFDKLQLEFYQSLVSSEQEKEVGTAA
ncbi:hypothetical protein ACFL2V_00560 [Pseudomonadota bacterium]